MIHPIYQLVEYALQTRIIEPADYLYSVNALMEVMGLDEIPAPDEADFDAELPPVHEILDALIDIAAEKGLVDPESIVARDLFDTKLMGRLTPPPSVIIDTFDYLYGESPEEAT
ncbi:MAG: galactose-1-phosphate uridylyltransferase, partial [Firmicutes bacterium]|nr:galactose-1-phosphate uridylyltransferase [Bacillota bacterium]